MNIVSVLKNRVVKNAGWLIAGRIVQMIAGFFVGIFTARYLGPSNYGLVNYAASYTAFFTSVATLGINSVLVKELVNRREKEGEVLGTTLLLKFIASVLSSITIFIISFCIDFGERETIIVVVLSSFGLIFNLLESFNYWFQSHLFSKVSAIATLVGYLVISSYKIYLMVSGKSVEFFAVTTSLDYLCVGVILIICYRKMGGQKLRYSAEYAKALLKKSLHFVVPSLMVAVYAQTDKIMLKNMIDKTEVGYYSTAVSLCSMWCFILGAIIDSLGPTIMEEHKHGYYERFITQNKRLYAIVFYVSLVVSALYCLLATPLVSILYGQSYINSVVPLRIITWYTAFSYLGVARNVWVVCENKQKFIWPIYLSAALSNIVLNLILIPRYGCAGAAVASLAAQVITTMVTPFFIRELKPNAKLMVEAILLKDVFNFKRKKD